MDYMSLPNWNVIKRDSLSFLENIFKFGSFKEAMNFSLKISEIADENDHHPEMVISWGKVIVRWWSHDINGISQRDKNLAVATEKIYSDFNNV